MIKLKKARKKLSKLFAQDYFYGKKKGVRIEIYPYMESGEFYFVSRLDSIVYNSLWDSLRFSSPEAAAEFFVENISAIKERIS